jgi:hypothetical protein
MSSRHVMVVANEHEASDRFPRSHWTEEVPAFWDVVRARMDEAGIEDVEELHRRYLETERAYIPTPGRHQGKPVSLAEFKRHLYGKFPVIYGELHLGLREVLELNEEQDRELVLSYMFGRPKMGVHPTRPLP